MDERPVRDKEYKKGSIKESKVYQRNNYEPCNTKSKFQSKDTSRSLKSSQNGIPSEVYLKGIVCICLVMMIIIIKKYKAVEMLRFS